MEENDNGMVYVIENKLVLTVEMIDPNNLEYIDIEIGGDKKREYPQTEFKKKKFPELNFEIEVDHRYQNKKDIDIKSADSKGNFNRVDMKPINDWMADNFDWKTKGNTNEGRSNGGSRGANDEFRLTTGKYNYRHYKNKLPSSYKNGIVSLVSDFLEDIYDGIMDNYKDRLHNIYKIRGMENFYLYNHLNDEKWQYAGIALYSILDIFKTQDYDNIKIKIERFNNNNLPEKLNNPYFAIMEFLSNDIKTLESVYGSNEKVMNELHKIFTQDIQMKLYDNPIFEPCIGDNDNDGVPNIIEWGYGTHWKLNYDDGPSNDIDNDGISDFNELKVIFRPSLEAFKTYTSGWIDISTDDLNHPMVRCEYWATTNMNLHKNYPDDSKNPRRLLRKGETKDSTGISYKYFILKVINNLRKKNEETIFIVIIVLGEQKSMGKGMYQVSMYSFSMNNIENLDKDCVNLPNAIYFHMEGKLVPGANPIIKDIFVEIDWMWKSKTSNKNMYFYFVDNLLWYDQDQGDKNDKHVMSKKAKDKVKEAFKKRGINLHIDDGTDRIYGYNLGGGGPIPHEDKTRFYHKDGKNNDFWDKYKKYNFETTYDIALFNKRQRFYHYCIFAHDAENYDKTLRMGFGERPFTDLKGKEGADDLIIGDNNQLKDTAVLIDLYGLSDYYDLFRSLGFLPPIGDSDTIQAAMFMHELGHNLNLKFTGGDYQLKSSGEGFDPGGHKSCMNYYYILSKVDYTTGEWKSLNLNNIQVSTFYEI
jgi:hypothetical protein